MFTKLISRQSQTFAKAKMSNLRALSAMGASPHPSLRTFAQKIDGSSNSEVAQAEEYERSL